MAEEPKEDTRSALERIADEGLKFNPIDPSKPFSKEEFSNYYGSLHMLSQEKPSDFSGIIYGVKALDDSPSSEGIKNHILGLYNRNLIFSFGRAKTKDLAGLVLESSPDHLIDYALKTPIFEGDNPKYEETRKAFETAKKEFETFGKDQQAYGEEKIKGMGTFTREIVRAVLPRLLAEHGRVLSVRRIKPLEKYGLPDFVSDNLQAAWKVSEKEGATEEQKATAPQMTDQLIKLAYITNQEKQAADEEEAKKKKSEEPAEE